MVQHAAEEV